MTKEEFIEVLDKHAEKSKDNSLYLNIDKTEFIDVANELEQLGLFEVSGCFSAEHLREAFKDGWRKEGELVDFDLNNYR